MAEPLWSEDSLHTKERKKWDTPKRLGGMRCDGYEAYPRMLYRAQPNPLSGVYEVGATRDVLSKDKTVVIFNAEEFSRTCQHIVNNESEHARAREQGWRDTPQEAIAYHNGSETEALVEAAKRAYADRNMGEKAKAEADAYEASTDKQVPEIPEGRKRKAS